MLNIGLILPDVLGTYGDDGNALVLRQRARMRGIEAKIHPIKLGQPVPETYDLYTLGGGEDTAQILAAEHLLADGGLTRAANAGRPIFAVCAGLQVLGTSFKAGGRTVSGVGLLDMTTRSLSKRAIGEVIADPQLEDLTQTLTGFENHMGATILGADAYPLGRISTGVGNADRKNTEELEDGDIQVLAEGAVQGSIVATYMHGPALARNPQLADYLLAKAMGVEMAALKPLNIPAVTRLRSERLA